MIKARSLFRNAAMGLAVVATVGCARADEAVFRIHADEPLHRITPYLTGACIEDVNHEIYGGLYSQMIFGESFQEEAFASLFKGFTAYGGQWMPTPDGVRVDRGAGFKLVATDVTAADGEISVEVFFSSERRRQCRADPQCCQGECGRGLF